MKHKAFTWFAGSLLGLALITGGCERKSEQSSAPATSQAPVPEKASPNQSGMSQPPSADTGTTGSVQGQNPEESKEAPKG